MKLGYLVFETRTPERWRSFCTSMLGLPAPTLNPDGSEGYRLDEAVQRLVVAPGEREDLAAIGLELPNDEALASLVARAAQAGVDFAPIDEELCRSRRAETVVRFRDPAGNWIEAYVAPERAAEPFASEHFPTGFDTALGMGHIALVHHDIEAMERFYVDVLGHGVSERMASRIGPIDFRGAFLHCNRRHHTIALLSLPIEKRVHHFMLEAKAHGAVGRAFERAKRLGVPLSLGLGQHSDDTFSFYAATPSGFDFEIGAGCRPIDPEVWTAVESADDRLWGHEPTMRTKLKILGAIVRHHLTPSRRPQLAPA